MQPILAPNVGSQNGPNSGATRSPPVSGGPGPLCLIGTFFNGRLIGNCGALLAILSPYWQGWRLLGRVGNIFFFFFFSLLFFFFFSHPPSFFSFPFLSAPFVLVKIPGANPFAQKPTSPKPFPETLRGWPGQGGFSNLSADKFEKCQKGPKGGETFFGAVVFVTILGFPGLTFSSKSLSRKCRVKCPDQPRKVSGKCSTGVSGKSKNCVSAIFCLKR